MTQNRKLLILTISFWMALAIIYFKFFDVSRAGGVILGEPDEFAHSQIVARLPATRGPFYSGKPFFYDPPFFFWASSLLNLAFKNSLQAVRVTSFAATLLSSLMILYYGRKRGFSRLSSLASSLVFLLVPLTVFYSQVGLIEPLLTFLLLGFFVFYDLYLLDRCSRDSFVAGLFLALAVLTKYTALVVAPIVSLVFLYRCIRLNIERRKTLKEGYWLIDLASFYPLLLAGLLVVPVLALSYLKSPFEFKLQTYQVLGLTRAAVFVPFTNLSNPDFTRNIFWWFSPIFLLICFLGLTVLFTKKARSSLFLVVTAFLMVASVTSRLPFHPRYLVVLTPFLALLTLSLFSLLETVFRKAPILVVLFLFFYIFYQKPALTNAYRSSKVNLLEQAVGYVGKIDPQREAWIFSNYWPNIIAQLSSRNKFGWLTLDNREISIFNPEESRTGLQIMEEESSFILVEDLYSKLSIVAPGPRDEALKYLVKNYQPEVLITDSSPNFPFVQKNGNTVEIYRLPISR